MNNSVKENQNPAIQSSRSAKHPSSDAVLSKQSLDTRVAIQIMKWIPVVGNYWMGSRPGGGKWNCSIAEADGWAFEYPGGVRNPDGKEYCTKSRFQWNPSDDIGDAMEVVEKLRQSGEWCCITLKSDYHYIWWVSLTRAEGATKLNPEHKPTIARSDESLPVAICRAALATAATT